MPPNAPLVDERIGQGEENEHPFGESWPKGISRVRGSLFQNDRRFILELQKDAIGTDAQVEGWNIVSAPRKAQIALTMEDTTQQVPKVDLEILLSVLSLNYQRSHIALYRELEKRISREAILEFLDAARSALARVQLSLEHSGRFSRSQEVSFVRGAQELEARDYEEASLDLIYDSVDELLQKGEFAEVDRVLREISVDELSVDLLLALLTATLPAADRLECRSTLFIQIEKSLRERNELDDTLLLGLEG